MRTNPVVKCYEDGSVYTETWYNENNEIHRDDGPAFRKLSNDGFERELIWVVNGIRHRRHGPAYISWHVNDQMEKMIWYCDGNGHREGGPALRQWDDEGEISEEFWYNHGIRHRLYGPAYINYTRELFKEFWYIDGVNITTQVSLISSTYNLPHWSEWSDDDKLLFRLSLR